MLIDEHLDVSKCASIQNTILLKIVQDKVCGSIAHALMDAHHVKAIAKFPDLENYARCWPVTDLVMMRLKYTSSRARRQEMEMAAGKAKKLVWNILHVICFLPYTFYRNE